MDDTKPESVVRLLGGDVGEDARKAAVNKVHAIALGCLGLGAAGLYYAAAAMAAGSTAYTVLAMLGLAVFGGYAYQLFNSFLFPISVYFRMGDWTDSSCFVFVFPGGGCSGG